MKINELYNELCWQIPESLKLEWDNDGLQVSFSAESEVTGVVTCLDITEESVETAIANNCNCIASHHPLIFGGMKAFELNDPKARLIISLVENGISTMSFHTRYDALEGGMNDILASALGFKPIRRIGPDGEKLVLVCSANDTIMSIILKCKMQLGCPYVNYTGDPDRIIKTVALCGGEGKDFIENVINEKVDLYICGNSGYNKTVETIGSGTDVLELGHYYSESVFISDMAERIRNLGIDAVELHACPINSF